MKNQFRKDVVEGLSTPQKKLSSKYFYNKKGDELFVKIMAMPEYYLTRAELDIFKNKTNELIAAFNLKKEVHFDLIELGAGDGTKTIFLLKELLKQGFDFDYVPIDISKNALEGLTNMLHKVLPSLSVTPKTGDYFVTLEQLNTNKNPKIILVLGSNIGNLTDDKAAKFIYELGANLSQGDKVLLGVDLKKAKEIVLPAYNDANGITAEFNLNLLDRINEELGADFKRANFEHKAHYEENEGIAKSFLISKVDQKVTMGSDTFVFKAGEAIHTEVSRKYDDAIIKEILKETNIEVIQKVTDAENLFADYILERK